ncbi:hypothetical protein GCM10028821_42970 [Hymenobacter jeollabukensis]
MQVRDEDAVDAPEADALLDQAFLGGLAAVNQVRLAAHGEHLRRVVAPEHGRGGSAAEYRKLKLQNSGQLLVARCRGGGYKRSEVVSCQLLELTTDNLATDT